MVAPLEGTVIPLPHQLLALQRAISGDRIRYLLADEVGLGKTIEAGLILRELKIWGLVRRILVVAPAGLVLQWQSEMKSHFNEDFRLILPGNLSALRQAGAIDENQNLWRMHNQVICPLNSVKPVELPPRLEPGATRPLQSRTVRRPCLRRMGPDHHR